MVGDVDALRQTKELAVRVVGKRPGAIAYVRASYLTAEVKALRIDGRAPGQTGYALS
jgi:hypothetical protein